MGASTTGRLVFCVIVGAACGASPPPVEEPPVPAAPTPAPVGRPDGMEVEGLMGTLSREEITRALEPRMGRFTSCVTRAYARLELIGGELTLAFRIATDGTPRWVRIASSTLGDRETERCIRAIAAATRFPEPHGGEAEFTWPLSLGVSEDVRPPLAWDQGHVAEVLGVAGPPLAERCALAPGVRVRVTAYVGVGGRVLASGADAPETVDDGALACVESAVGAWPMPDPGSYPAKVTFEVP